MTRLAWLALAIAAVAVARYRPALRPVALALAALAFLDAARATGLPARLDVAAWCVWPGVAAALAVLVWPLRRSLLTFALFCAYAAGIALAPWSWRAHPLAFAAAIRAPHVAACMVALWAWSTKSEGPGVRFPSPSKLPPAPARDGEDPPAVLRLGLRTPRRPRGADRNGARSDQRVDHTHGFALAQARRIASILALSGFVDFTAGALLGPWHLAAPLSWATMAAVAGVLLTALRRPPDRC